MVLIKINYANVSPIIKITYDETPVYVKTSVNNVYAKVVYGSGGGGGGVSDWGDIGGTLSDQTDLQNALDAKVPYSGATANVNLGEYEMKAGQMTLDTSPTGTAGVGTTRWNDTTGSSETTLKGGSVVLKNGVDLVARIVNKVSPNTTLTKASYQAVRISGAQGQRLAVELAQANNDNNSADTIGLVTETISPNQEGFIMTVGSLESINTTGSLQGETWTDGDVLYLSPTTAGRITNVKPIAPQHLVVIGYVEYAHQNNGKIYVKVMNGWELGELHDVSVINPNDNDILQYKTSTGLWSKTAGTTTNISEGTNLYYTDTRSKLAISSSATGLTYTNTTGVFSMSAGYAIPTTTKQSNWDDAYTFVGNFPTQTGNSGKYLTTDGSSLSWGAISATLSGLSDVELTSPVNLQYLTYNGTKWVNKSLGVETALNLFNYYNFI